MAGTNMMDKPLDGAGLMTVNQIVNNRLAGKQDKLTGTAGQVVGFDAAGNPTAQGTDSMRGPKGDKGDKGDTGAAGPAGKDGATGPQGPKGDTGPQGPKGATGATGPQGPKGDAGSVGADGTPGKSAYEYAVEGGYTGTESEFRALISGGPWLPLSGGTMTGAIRLKTSTGGVGEVRLEGSATNGTNVGQFGFTSNGRPTFSFAEKSGSSTVPMRICGVAEPVGANDAANKEYVDNKFFNLSLGSFARIQTGVYFGTGTYGENNYNELYFDFNPRVVFITPFERTGSNAVFGGYAWLTASNVAYTEYRVYNACTLLTGDNFIRWYGTSYTNQLNMKNMAYVWVAIG